MFITHNNITSLHQIIACIVSKLRWWLTTSLLLNLHIVLDTRWDSPIPFLYRTNIFQAQHRKHYISRIGSFFMASSSLLIASFLSTLMFTMHWKKSVRQHTSKWFKQLNLQIPDSLRWIEFFPRSFRSHRVGTERFSDHLSSNIAFHPVRKSFNHITTCSSRVIMTYKNLVLMQPCFCGCINNIYVARQEYIFTDTQSWRNTYH